MRKTLLLLWILITAQSCGYGSGLRLPEAIQGQQPPSHQAWDRLLKTHVDAAGLVDYAGFAQDRDALQGYLDLLAAHIPGDHWSRAEKLAYFINLYNAGTILLILDHYPLESIRDIWNPWGKDFLTIGSSSYSLNDIEHGILRKMDEPRIHFAVNCASYSCPKLRRDAYRAAAIDAQLNAAATDFINDPERNHLQPGAVEISRIFKWYKGDFTRQGQGLLEYINAYLPEPLPQDTDIGYLRYDWTLNAQR